MTQVKYFEALTEARFELVEILPAQVNIRLTPEQGAELAGILGRGSGAVGGLYFKLVEALPTHPKDSDAYKRGREFDKPWS